MSSRYTTSHVVFYRDELRRLGPVHVPVDAAEGASPTLWLFRDPVRGLYLEEAMRKAVLPVSITTILLIIIILILVL